MDSQPASSSDSASDADTQQEVNWHATLSVYTLLHVTSSTGFKKGLVATPLPSRVSKL